MNGTEVSTWLPGVTMVIGSPLFAMYFKQNVVKMPPTQLRAKGLSEPASAKGVLKRGCVPRCCRNRLQPKACSRGNQDTFPAGKQPPPV